MSCEDYTWLSSIPIILLAHTPLEYKRIKSRKHVHHYSAQEKTIYESQKPKQAGEPPRCSSYIIPYSREPASQESGVSGEVSLPES